MNSVLCERSNPALNKYQRASDNIYMNRAQYEEAYATAPMPAVGTKNIAEEELHLLFESAISCRLLAMREQMDRISGPLPQPRNCQTEALPIVAKQPKSRLVFHRSWQRALVYGSLGLMLTMLGFDLMGLLVLFTR